MLHQFFNSVRNPSINLNGVLLLIFLIGALLNFLPLFIEGYTMVDPITKRYPDYLYSLSSFEYTVSVVASLATTVPILADYLFDRFLTATNYYDEISSKENESPSIYIPLRETIAALIIPDILLLGWMIPFGLYDYVIILVTARDTLYTYSLLRCLVKFENPVWTWKSLVFICGPLMVNNVLLSFAALSTDAIYIENTRTSTYVFVSVGLSSLLVNAIYWFWHFFHLNEKEVEIGSYLCSAYVVLVVFFLFANWIPLFLPTQPGDPWYGNGVSYQSYISYLIASCTLCLTVISTRCASIDATRKLLSVKQMFMRYISHEMRTPLNVACLGIKFLRDELERLGLLILLDTAIDTEKSCKTAVDILNDMLLYDKIVSGLMVLDKRFIAPLDFITKVLSPFYLQAREAGIDLLLQPDVVLQTSAVRLHADPYKISQAIRNLVSNALKFTRASGTVRVVVSVESSSYEPGGVTWIGEGDIEAGPVARRVADLNKALRRYGRRQSVIYAESTHLIISVEDSGVGISTENQAKLFKGVVQFQPGLLQKGQGTGLGLYITKQIVRQHKGTVSVHSAGEGHGTTFTVRVPCMVRGEGEEWDRNEELFDIEADSKPPITASSQSALTPSFQQPFVTTSQQLPDDTSTCSRQEKVEEQRKKMLKVLMVDDSEANCKMVCKVLENTKDFHCQQAADGSVAVEMVRHQMMQIQNKNFDGSDDVAEAVGTPYDIILMDYQMPEMDGPTAIVEIRRLGYKGIILGLTGNALIHDREVMLNAGADGVLVKPLNMQLFRQLLRDFTAK